MRIISSIVLVAIGLLLGPGSLPASAADDDGVALGILYDTSGSMSDRVPDSHGGTSPKYLVANHALLDVVKQIEAYTTNGVSGAPRKIDVGLFTFSSSGGAQEVVKLGPFNAGAIRNWTTNFSSPTGGTPLGNALRTVSRDVLNSPMPRKHVLIITDGENTVGPAPDKVLPEVNRAAEKKQSPVFVHFIAFDVDAKVFNGVKKAGASVASAADETQLNSQLDFILQNQILLEKPSTTK
jgi:von Willebrand factor type A domain